MKNLKDLIPDYIEIDNEEWKEILLDGEPSNYFVSNYGNIVSFKKKNPKLMKKFLMPSGYRLICLSKDKKDYWYLVHRLVAMYFIPIPDNLKEQGYTFKDLEVNHKDGTYEGKSVNTVDNLEWVTSSENKIHAYKNNLKKQGEECPASKYTNEQIEITCKLLQDNKIGVREITKITGIPYSTISQLLKKRQWKEITKKYDFSKRKRIVVQYDKETIENVKRLLLERKSGKNNYTNTEIGNMYGMTRTSVWYIENHKLE